MTEWAASDDARILGLQQPMAKEALSLVDVQGGADIACGSGNLAMRDVWRFARSLI